MFTSSGYTHFSNESFLCPCVYLLLDMGQHIQYSDYTDTDTNTDTDTDIDTHIHTQMLISKLQSLPIYISYKRSQFSPCPALLFFFFDELHCFLYTILILRMMYKGGFIFLFFPVIACKYRTFFFIY